jgi:hypothetical protein
MNKAPPAGHIWSQIRNLTKVSGGMEITTTYCYEKTPCENEMFIQVIYTTTDFVRFIE